MTESGATAGLPGTRTRILPFVTHTSVVVGNPKPASKTLHAASLLAEGLAGQAPDSVLDLVELGARLLSWGDETVQRAADTVARGRSLRYSPGWGGAPVSRVASKYSSGRPATPVSFSSSQRRVLPLRWLAQTRYDRFRVTKQSLPI